MSITLTCTVTGKQVTWSNKTIIDAKIKQYGSLEAFRAAYVSKGAKRRITSNKITLPKDDGSTVMESVLNDGLKLGRMSREDYHNMYAAKVAALEAAGASQREIAWMRQRLERWRKE
jgi:hypothetical protein